MAERDTEITAQQAADLLNVSVEYIERLADDGHLPDAQPAGGRLLRLQDVLAFKERRDRERRRALDELARITEEIGGYTREDV